ncbi:MAG: alpha/beta hydrolase [Candidatus Doudnabacteria bacterium]|nr:alpha/beta hydrolase [Candidatus Doudnabacteria bacterium]
MCDAVDEMYLVGHSLGGTAILRYLERYESKKYQRGCNNVCPLPPKQYPEN